MIGFWLVGNIDDEKKKIQALHHESQLFMVKDNKIWTTGQPQYNVWEPQASQATGWWNHKWARCLSRTVQGVGCAFSSEVVGFTGGFPGVGLVLDRPRTRYRIVQESLATFGSYWFRPRSWVLTPHLWFWMRGQIRQASQAFLVLNQTKSVTPSSSCRNSSDSFSSQCPY